MPLLFFLDNAESRTFTFDGANRLDLATSLNAGASQGMNFGQYSWAQGNLILDFASGSTSINFPSGTPGDTGLLVNRRVSGRGGLYQGDVSIAVREGARLDVNNSTSYVTTNPVSDAIEVEVQDRGTDATWVPGQAGSQGSSSIAIDFEGAADIVTSNGAGFYLVQGGTGDIAVKLSKDVSITTKGESRPGEDSLNNHGINAVVASGGAGLIDIDSAATINVTGGKTSAIFAFGDSAEIRVKTREGEDADGSAAPTITVAGDDGSGIRTSASNGNTYIENDERIKVTGQNARGIYAEVAELSKLTKVQTGANWYELNYQENAAAGDSKGTIQISNRAQLEIDGLGATGILAERSMKAESLEAEAAQKTGIVVENTGRLRLDSTGTTGVRAVDSTGASVAVTNAGAVLMYDRNDDSTGEESPDAPRADDFATTGSTGLSVSASGAGAAFVSNTGSMAIYGLKDGDSANAGIKALTEKGDLTVENSGRLYLTGVGNVAIDAESASGDVVVMSTGLLELDGTGRSARPTGGDKVSTSTGTWGIRAKTGGEGHVTIISQAPDGFSPSSGVVAGEDHPSLSIMHNHGTGIEVETVAGALRVLNSKDMALTGDDNTGILAVTQTGALSVANSGGIRVKGGSSRGIEVESTGEDGAGLVSVTSRGRILFHENSPAKKTLPLRPGRTGSLFSASIAAISGLSPLRW